MQPRPLLGDRADQRHAGRESTLESIESTKNITWENTLVTAKQCGIVQQGNSDSRERGLGMESVRVVHLSEPSSTKIRDRNLL